MSAKAYTVSDMSKAPLIQDIENFLSATGMGETYFGKLAVGNSELVRRLRAGKPVLTTTEDRVRKFIADRLTENERGAA